MRVKPTASFPHPVLGAPTGDYENRSFILELSVQEAPSVGSIVLGGMMSLEDASVSALIQTGSAVAGLMITCQDTYLDRFEKCGLGELTVDLSGGLVRGTVFVRGAIIATRQDVLLSSEAINQEFPPEARVVRLGDIIALTEEQRFEAGLEKLAPLESIFTLKPNEDVLAGSFDVFLDSEAVEIHASPELFQFLSLFREQATRDVLLAALYLPVVMQVLETMRTDDFADRRWFSVMKSRCSAEGIDPKDDLAYAAQKLLDAPLGALKATMERFS